MCLLAGDERHEGKRVAADPAAATALFACKGGFLAGFLLPAHYS
jgi:hypothetical protein